jgi:7-cyano-7-deazaguanine synthase
MSAIVVLSGGLDSTVALAEALELNLWNSDLVGAVTFQYGQKHDKEIEAARVIAEYYHLKYHHVVDLPLIFSGSGSVLIKSNEMEMPRVSYKDIDESYGVSPTYVPFRNANFLSMATSLALVNDADEVWAGMHAEDAHNWAYPDCTPEFIGAMAGAIYVGSYHKVRLVTPHEWRSKAEVVQRGVELDVPFDLTWSCYDGGEYHCGTCPTCVGRIGAFRSNKDIDPVPYEIGIDWT